jgi:hypothetical protein
MRTAPRRSHNAQPSAASLPRRTSLGFRPRPAAALGLGVCPRARRRVFFPRRSTGQGPDGDGSALPRSSQSGASSFSVIDGCSRAFRNPPAATRLAHAAEHKNLRTCAPAFSPAVPFLARRRCCLRLGAPWASCGACVAVLPSPRLSAAQARSLHATGHSSSPTPVKRPLVLLHTPRRMRAA